MRKVTYGVIILSVLLIGVGTAQATPIVAEPNIVVKYLGWDKNFNSPRVQVNIESPETGKLVYIENYYSIDSFGQPKFYSSNRYETPTDRKKVSFKILRPKDGRGQRYSLIEKLFIINGQRTASAWYDLHNSWN